MGSRLLRTIPEIGGQTPPLSEIPDYLRKLNPTLVRDGIRLAMENGKIQAEDLLKILEQVGSPQVGIVLDMVNSLAVPEGWKAVTRLLAPYVMCLHYKDFIVKRAWHMMGLLCEGRPAGQGLVDAAWLFNALQASHYDFNVILELWPPEQPMLEDTIALEDQWAKESIPFLRRFVQE
jgi:sugar phosphate isomerase/epimerase